MGPPEVLIMGLGHGPPGPELGAFAQLIFCNMSCNRGVPEAKDDGLIG